MLQRFRRSTRDRRLFTQLDAPSRDAGGQGPTLSSDALVLMVSLWFTATCNLSFWRAWLQGRDMAWPSTWWLIAATVLALTALHFVVMAPLANRWTARPLLALLVLVASFSSYFIGHYGIYLDASMLRNVLRTDVAEARELLALSLLLHLALTALGPLWLLWRVRLVRRPIVAAVIRRGAAWALAAVVGVLALLSVYQDAASNMRNHREMRYLITPGNALWSSARVLRADAGAARAPRQAIGTDAARGARAADARRKPLRIVLVVGETARAANWGLNGYHRQTTPQLAALPELISFAPVASCGTNTEVSLPCMFSPGGRRRYDEATVRGSESLLHVLQRAGVQVLWRDNQSGCKGVCDGLDSEVMSAALAPGWCDGERCLDEALLHGLAQRLGKAGGAAAPAALSTASPTASSTTSSTPSTAATAPRRPADQLIVLHQLGNHGPAYDRRYPDAFRRFTPVCASSDLRRCSREEIVNAYDNALLYTDHVLARAIDWLREGSADHDTALVYVSDHGESLGESGLYLHGLPYAIAPLVQRQVPMLMWLSAGLAQQHGIDTACLRQRAAQATSHDHLFHSLLGLMDVSTRWYEAPMDVFAGCRR